MDYYQSGMGFPSYMRGRPPVGMSTRRFDEYYRCYPVVMMSGPDREHANYGGKIFLPPSALEKLTRLHITYPMLFELINGAAGTTTHAGVLEFVAEEGRVYLPQWLMRSLVLEPGDLLQIKSTDLPPGNLIKLQPQSVAFLDISDPKAVLENAFRNFSCLTKGDVFAFSYNDQTYDIAVLEIKPENDQHAIVTMETDLQVEFAPPVGYKEPERKSGTSTPRSVAGAAHGGSIHFQGTMAQSINYASIAPGASAVTAGAKAASSNFASGGHKLSSKKGSIAPTPNPSTPVAGASVNPAALPSTHPTNGPQPLRLAPGKLFFGYEYKPPKQKDENGEPIPDSNEMPKFQGQGQTLRSKKRPGADSEVNSGVNSGVNSDAETISKVKKGKEPGTGGSSGRTLR